MTADARTLAAYAENAQQYAETTATDDLDIHLGSFIDALPKGARVLDLGCGPGHEAARIRAAGLLPDPIDASPEMVALANQCYAVAARVATFDEITAVAAYDGIWANFSLLHAPRAAMPRLLAGLRSALKPGGLFHIGMKLGTGEGRDRLDRFYSYYSRDELADMLTAAGLHLTDETLGQGCGLAGTLDPIILMRAHA